MTHYLPTLKAAVAFPDLVAETHEVRSGGKVLCPAHDDHTPSCHIYGDGYKCFACGAYGDAIDWLELVYRLSTAEAIAELERRVGGYVPPTSIEPASRHRPTEFKPVDDATLRAHYRRADALDRVPAAVAGRSFTLDDLQCFAFAAYSDDAVFPVTSPDGRVLALKRRYAEPYRGQRYGYTTPGHGTPAWCSPDFMGRSEVLVTEGEFNAMACWLARPDLAVMGVAGTGGSLHPEALMGRTVYCYGDGDEPGQKARDKWAQQALEAGASKVFVLDPWETDACDLAGSRGRAALADELTRSLTSAKTADIPKHPKRRTIQVNNRYLRDITADALNALKAANNPPSFFMRGTVPVRVGEEARAEALTNTSLKGTLDRVADFVKVTTKQSEDGKPTTEETPARPPSDLAPDILTRPSLPFPRLEAIATAPVVLPDGNLLLEDAFNEEHGILLRLDGLENLRADMPADEALALLDDVFGDFPFAEPDAGQAHTHSMLLQSFIRPLVRGPTPLYLIDAPARGTGKGLLSEVMALITSGRPAPVMSQPRDGDELEKRITSVLLEGRPIVFLDNVTQLKSPHLAAALTAEVWQGRILGKSELVSVPNRAVWLATGNNVEISDEFARRIIPIRLDAGVERPEDRKNFRHANLPEYVRAHRSVLVSACLSLIQKWIDAGMPKGEKTLGRFESWAGIVGGILEVAGVSGFLSGRERLYNDADSETKEWALLCAAWWKSYEARPITAGDAFEVAKEDDLLLDLWGGRSVLGAKQRFGHALSARRDRVFGAYKVVSAGRDSATRNAAYRLKRVGIETPETPETSDPEQEDAPITQERKGVEAGCFVGTASETPDKHQQNTRRESSARDGASRPEEGVTGVLGVLVGPPDNQDDDLSPLVGTVEGEL